MSQRINLSAPTMKVLPTTHFLIQIIKRSFELSALIPAYYYIFKNIENMEIGQNFEFSIGHSTIVCSLDENKTIWLVTGWTGNRKKENKWQS